MLKGAGKGGKGKDGGNDGNGGGNGNGGDEVVISLFDSDAGVEAMKKAYRETLKVRASEPWFCFAEIRLCRVAAKLNPMTTP